MPTTTRFDVDALRAEFPSLERRGPDGRPAVFLDGPGGIALTLTPGAAGETGRNLIGASEIAEQQAAEKDRA